MSGTLAARDQNEARMKPSPARFPSYLTSTRHLPISGPEPECPRPRAGLRSMARRETWCGEVLTRSKGASVGMQGGAAGEGDGNVLARQIFDKGFGN